LWDIVSLELTPYWRKYVKVWVQNTSMHASGTAWLQTLAFDCPRYHLC